MSGFEISRRSCLLGLFTCSLAAAQQNRLNEAPAPEDWSCPMDPDYHSSKPGFCPRCGMKLVLKVPDRVEYPFEMSHLPESLKPGKPATLIFRVLDPNTSLTVKRFEIVHEKLMHLFIVNENLEFFAHLHPELRPDGSFTLPVTLPYGGMYRLLADFYPDGSTPQLAVKTLYVTGACAPSPLVASLGPSQSVNLRASLRLDPERPLAGFETKLFFTLDPASGLEPYLGAWGHMLAASEDLVDLIHSHPFIADGGPSVQFNLLFPRAGMYKVWTQFQRQGVVNTVVFTIPVAAL
jgi:hypothetical protein